MNTTTGKYDQTDELEDLQLKVIYALEKTDPALAEKAEEEIHDMDTDSQRKAWLAIYGPLTDILA